MATREEADTRFGVQLAELFTKNGQPFARWKPAKGKTRTAKVTTGADGSPRILDESGTYLATFRDGSGYVCEVSTGCRDEDAARSVLGKLERRAELVKSEVLSKGESAMADHQATPVANHFAAYHEHRTAKGLSAVRIANTKSRLERLAAECDFRRLADCSADALTRWLVLNNPKGSRNPKGCRAGTGTSIAKSGWASATGALKLIGYP